MFRRNLVLFFRRNKEKIATLTRLIALLVACSFIATIILAVTKMSSSSTENSNISNNKERETIIYGNDIKKEEYISDKELIDRFINCCNKGKIKEAYEMISSDCKNACYNNINEFKKLYYKHVFEVDKLYEIQSWITNEEKNTYQVKLITDSFDLGRYENTNYIEDFYTIINEGKEKKISINKYVHKEDINKQTDNNRITINALSVNKYINYEIYFLEIKNLTANDIILDTKETTNSIYLTDNNDVKYSAYIHELTSSDLLIKSKEKKTIQVKFNKTYNPNTKITSIHFNDILVNNVNSDQIKIQFK